MHSARINIVNDKPVLEQNSYVLYWMTTARRTEYNFALDHAIATANKLGKGLVVFEGLRQDYRWACDRFHAFIQEGMIENQSVLLNSPVTYIPCIETPETPIKEIFWALAEKSCLIISELYPAFFFPKMHRLVASQTSVQFRLVDTNGIYPLSESERIYTTAASFRRHLQKTIEPFLKDFPKSSSVNALKRSYTPSADDFTEEILNLFKQDISSVDIQTLPIDHSIFPVKDRIGGQQQARIRLSNFLDHHIERYGTDRNSIDQDPSSGLSPYLHFGHISVHEMVQNIWEKYDWNPSMVAPKATGSRSGWWNLPAGAEAYMDQIITWREIGFVYCYQEPNYASYDTLPNWARITMEEHIDDPRPFTYTLETFEKAQTHDPIWNAAQRQLVCEGRIHNYLRMLWAKKVLHWTKTPQDALEILEELNNKYALDGRDPNSYSGIYWTFGRFDRAWTERPIFGKIRYMTSDSTKRKIKLKNYLNKFSRFTQ